jgi:hypothetical protein
MIKLGVKVALFLTVCWVVLTFAMGYKPVNALPDVLVLHVSDPLNTDVARKEYLIHSNDLVHARLKQLIIDDESIWTPIFASYIGASIQFVGEGLSIKCYPDLIVLDYSKFGSWWSYERKIPGLIGLLGLSERESIAPK